jgi:hypothetical protein
MSANTIKPRYEHDCDECRFVGQTVSEGVFYDLYVCVEQGTYVARYGNEGEDYSTARTSFPDDLLLDRHKMTRALLAANG